MSYALDAGQLNKRVTVLEFSESSDGAGGYVDTWPTVGWSTVCSRWARIEPLRGRSYFEAQQAQTEITHRVTMRYSALVKPEHTINYDGRRLDIRTVINVEERGDWMELMCAEVVG
jgi:SPP1 family predicted phage head-tail adaptor